MAFGLFESIYSFICCSLCVSFEQLNITAPAWAPYPGHAP